MHSHNYISTRGSIEPITFEDAVMMGLADDGGLLLPAEIPRLSSLKSWRQLSYPELAMAIIRLFADGGLSDGELQRLTADSYRTFSHSQTAPVHKAGPLYILELFHGPTLAFKDIALQFLGNLFEHLLRKRGGELNLLGATSGDTGSAAIHGVRGKDNIRIFVMHPKGRVSLIQEKQMTTVLDENVHNLAIEGSFDDGQRILKNLFSDLDFKRRYSLGAVNSVNWARVLAQVVYYFYAAFRVQEETACDKVQFAVPTGNFGDIFAGYVAFRMGAPIEKLILACNENDILYRFFSTGVYSKGEVKATLSPAMDIQVASNFERYLYYRLAENPEAVRTLMEEFAKTGSVKIPGEDPVFVAGTMDREGTLSAIGRYYRQFGYLLDPHTAVGASVAEGHLRENVPTICLATAHPAKFPDAIRQAVGEDIAKHPLIEEILHLPSQCHDLPAEEDAVRDYVERRIQNG